MPGTEQVLLGVVLGKRLQPAVLIDQGDKAAGRILASGGAQERTAAD